MTNTDELREQIRKVLKNNLVVVMGDIPPPTRAELDFLSAQLEPLTQRIALEARLDEAQKLKDYNMNASQFLSTRSVNQYLIERKRKLKRQLQELDGEKAN